MECIPESWQHVFLLPPTLIPHQVYQFKVFSTGETRDPWESIVIRCNENEQQKDSEITWFYENGGCDPETKEAIMQNVNNMTGMLIAAKATAQDQGDEREEGEIREEDAQGWLRAKVVQDMGEGNGKIKIFYVDYGIFAWVEKNEVYPLHKYFCKDPLMVVRMARKEWNGKIVD